ncbi:MAG: diguanylate cyclase [Candidatus Cloacimonetes bacterium]|nr:diguanylate cyclase [Candidatus Cloacimonadota bacterium]
MMTFQDEALSDLLLRNSKIVARSIGVSSKTFILTNNFVELPNILKLGIEGADTEYAYILDRDGICLSHTNPSKIGTRFSLSKIANWQRDFKSSGSEDKIDSWIVSKAREDIIDVIYPIRIENLKQFYGSVHLGVRKDYIYKSLGNLKTILIKVFLVALVMCFVLGVIIAHQINRSIQNMVGIAKSIENGDYEIKESKNYFREEGELKGSLFAMSNTIENQIVELKKSNQKLDRKVYEQKILMDASLKMNSKCYSNEVLDHILDSCWQGLSASWASLLLADEREKVLVPRLVRGEYCFPQGSVSIGWNEGVAGKVFQDLEPYIAHEGAKDRHFCTIDQPRESSIKSMICVPLIVDGKAIGVINVINKLEGSFTSEDQRLLLGLASLLARSIENMKLYNLAITDGLSGLYIKRYFLDRMNETIVQAKRYNLTFSLIYADIDFFKRVNDTYGHVVGDQVIKNASNILLAEARDNIDFVARIGGEEFAIILPETGKKGAVSLANRIRISAEETLAKQSGISEWPITMSFGVACFNDDATDMDELIQLADKALYVSKESGRNKVSTT